MADEKQVPLDLETMSDEDFMKLDPSDLQEFIPEEEEEDEDLDGTPGEDDDSSNSDANTSGDGDDEDLENGDKPPVADESGEADGDDGEGDQQQVEDDQVPAEKGVHEEPAKSTPDPKPKADDKPKAAGDLDPEAAAAVDFFKQVSAPFKADGRDMQVRTPQDVIRLMQMGVNYSRRMQEIKPLRAQDEMLKQNGLNDTQKLNFLIDLSKGNKDAIKQLLKDHNIDPMDIDTEDTGTPYKATNYEPDPRDIALDDAIKTTMSVPGGRELISDINKEWDDVSKEALREQPAIFENILAQKSSGVYAKIKDELNYQRGLGYLTNVPFLQAYHQVGEAMQKAGVFDEPKTQPQERKPVGTGPRKAAPRPNTEQPTPNISSATPPRAAPSTGNSAKNEPDYSSMSDEDFLKLAPPG
jgi:hypothetical protein